MKLNIPCKRGGHCNVHFDKMNVSGQQAVNSILARDHDIPLPLNVWCGKHRGPLGTRGIRILQSYFGTRWPQQTKREKQATS